MKLWTDAAVPEPFTPQACDRPTTRFSGSCASRFSARWQDSARDLMVDKLLAGARSLEGDDASLDQLHLLERPSESRQPTRRREETVRGRSPRSVAMLREEWSLHALDLCLTLDDNNEQSLAEAKALVEQIRDTSLLDEARPKSHAG